MTTKKKQPAFDVPEGWPVRDAAAYRPLSWFVPYPNNARTHPPAQVAMLARMLKAHGPDQPIVVDEDRVILKGHGRWQAAGLGGLEQFTFVQRLGLTEVEKTAMRLEDNQVALLSGWDPDLIRGEIGALKSAGYDVDLLGFGEAQLVQFTTTPAPPSQFPAVGADIPTEFQCPSCRYAWSGKPKPEPAPPKKPRRKKKR